MFTHYFILAITLFYSVVSQTIFYIDFTNVAGGRNGAIGTPYNSFQETITGLGVGNYIIRLLGVSGTVPASITFPAGSTYYITPNVITAGSYYPITLSANTVLVKGNILTFESIQFKDTSPGTRTTGNPYISAFTQLTLLNCYINAISSTTSYYFISGPTGSQTTITGCLFDTLQNLEMRFSGANTKLNATGNQFKTITNKLSGMITMSNIGTTGQITISNNLFDGGSIDYVSALQYGALFLGTNIGTTFTFDMNTIQNFVTAAKGSLIVTSSTYAANGNLYNTASFTNLLFYNNQETTYAAGNVGPFTGALLNLKMPGNIFMQNLTFTTINSCRAYLINVDNYYPMTYCSPSCTTLLVKGLYVNGGSYHGVNFNNLNNATFDGVTLRGFSVSPKYGFFALETTGQYVDNIYFNNIDSKNVIGRFYWTTIYPIIKVFSLKNAIFDTVTSEEMVRLYYTGISNMIIDNVQISSWTFAFANTAGINGNGLIMVNGVGIFAMQSSLTINNIRVIDADWGVLNFDVATATITNIDIRSTNIPAWNTLSGKVIPSIQVQQIKSVLIQNVYEYNITSRPFITCTQSLIYSFTSNLTLNNISLFDNTGTNMIAIQSLINPILLNLFNLNFTKITSTSGTVKISNTVKLTLNVLNSNFVTCTSTTSGGVFYIADAFSSANIYAFTGIIFTSNYAGANGGVFYFERIGGALSLTNNQYSNNNAVGLGGVGQILRGTCSLTDTQSSYQRNSATSGGNWQIEVTRTLTKAIKINLSFITFDSNSATVFGGAFNIFRGDASFSSCIFRNNVASIGGGDIYYSGLGSPTFSNVTFTNSSSNKGSSIWFDDFSSETVTMTNVIFQDSTPTVGGNLLVMNAGTFIFSSAQFLRIGNQVINTQYASISFSSSSFRSINAIDTQNYAAIAFGYYSGLSMTNVIIDTVSTVSGLFNLTGCNRRLLKHSIWDNVEITNIVGQDPTVNGTKGYDCDLTLKNSKFANWTLNGIFMQESNLTVDTCTFDNSKNNFRRVLATAPSIQFIHADSSTLGVQGTTFNSNSPGNTNNGGAISMTGNILATTIANSFFSNLNAANGGAVSITGQVQSLSLSANSFTSNVATSNGGAIFIGNNSLIGTAILDAQTFTNNAASIGMGGGIYTGSNNLSVTNSQFSSNKALYGGALASYLEQLSNIAISSSTFNSNNAAFAANILGTGTFNFDLNNNLSPNNTLLQGFPTKLRLKIYKYYEGYQYVDNPDPNLILTDNTTTLVFDSLDPNKQNPLQQQSGVTPFYIFEFTAIDDFKQTATQVLNGVTRVEIMQISGSNLNTSAIGIKGDTTYPFAEVGGINKTTIYKDFSLYGNLGDIVPVKATGAYFNPQFQSSVQMLPVFWSSEMVKCIVGQEVEGESLCKPCIRGFYSWKDPYANAECQPCNDKMMVCMGGSFVFPKPGYWRSDYFSDNFVKCPNPDACLGGNLTTKFVDTGVCQIGYRGKSCSECIEGWAKFGSSHECTNCNNNTIYYVKLCGYLVLEIFALWFSIRGFLASSTKNKSQDKINADIMLGTLVKILIDYVQTLNITAELDLNWPDALSKFYYGATKITPSNVDAFSFDCVLAMITGSNDNLYMYKTALLEITPIVLIIIVSLIWVAIFTIRRQKIIKNEEFKSRIFISALTIIYLLQPGIIKSTFQLYNCKNYMHSDSSTMYLESDTDIQCYTYDHLKWALGIGLPSLFVWLIIPCSIMIWIVLKRKKYFNSEFKEKYAFLVSRYEDRTFYWELVVILRKTLLVTAAVFITNLYAQAYFSHIILITAFWIQRQQNPYKLMELNNLEKMALVSSALMLFSGIYFTADETSLTVSIILWSVDFLFIAVFLITWLYYMRKVLKYKLGKSKVSPFGNFAKAHASESATNRFGENELVPRKESSDAPLNPSGDHSPIKLRMGSMLSQSSSKDLLIKEGEIEHINLEDSPEGQPIDEIKPMKVEILKRKKTFYQIESGENSPILAGKTVQERDTLMNRVQRRRLTSKILPFTLGGDGNYQNKQKAFFEKP